MEIEFQALAHGKYNRFLGRLITGGSGKRYHGFQCGDGRIIERPAPCDKQCSNGKEFSSRKTSWRGILGATLVQAWKGGSGRGNGDSQDRNSSLGIPLSTPVRCPSPSRIQL